jgi:hypothetical protein
MTDITAFIGEYRFLSGEIHTGEYVMVWAKTLYAVY